MKAKGFYLIFYFSKKILIIYLHLRVRFTLRNEKKLGKKTFMQDNVFVYIHWEVGYFSAFKIQILTWAWVQHPLHLIEARKRLLLDFYHINNHLLLLMSPDVEKGKGEEGRVTLLRSLQVIVHFVFQMTREWHSQYHFHLLQRNFWSLCAKMFHFKLSVWPATRHCVPTWSSLPISGL